MLKLLLAISLYYPLSLSLTFFQKYTIKNYHLPLLIVSGHYITKFILSSIIRYLVECLQRQRRLRVPIRDQVRWLMPIGFCASLDIGLSNWSLEYVTISLYTMAKSSSILFIVGFSLLLKLEKWHPILGLEAIFIAFGLFLFTWQSTQLDLYGLLLVELAAFCTGIRWTCSQFIMQSEDSVSSPHLSHPLDMIVHVQPWMFLAIFPIMIVIEGPEMDYYTLLSFNNEFRPGLVILLIFAGGLLAFLMEFSEYLLLVNTSGITLSILGVVKEGITLLLAHYLHGDQLSRINFLGLVICIFGVIIHTFSRRNVETTLRMDSFCASKMKRADKKILLPKEQSL